MFLPPLIPTIQRHAISAQTHKPLAPCTSSNPLQPLAEDTCLFSHRNHSKNTPRFGATQNHFLQFNNHLGSTTIGSFGGGQNNGDDPFDPKRPVYNGFFLVDEPDDPIPSWNPWKGTHGQFEGTSVQPHNPVIEPGGNNSLPRRPINKGKLISRISNARKSKIEGYENVDATSDTDDEIANAKAKYDRQKDWPKEATGAINRLRQRKRRLNPEKIKVDQDYIISGRRADAKQEYINSGKQTKIQKEYRDSGRLKEVRQRNAERVSDLIDSVPALCPPDELSSIQAVQVLKPFLDRTAKPIGKNTLYSGLIKHRQKKSGSSQSSGSLTRTATRIENLALQPQSAEDARKQADRLRQQAAGHLAQAHILDQRAENWTSLHTESAAHLYPKFTDELLAGSSRGQQVEVLRIYPFEQNGLPWTAYEMSDGTWEFSQP